MNRNILITTILIFQGIFIVPLHAQELNDSIILKAMTDELNSNITDLKYKDYEDPFYISYTLSHIQNYFGLASRGAVENSILNTLRNSRVRVLVGSYELNDENFLDQSLTVNSNSIVMPVPVDDDYWGIRQSFWSLTDGVYRTARMIYKNKLKLFEEDRLPEGFEPIPDFSREEVQVMDLRSDRGSLDKVELDNKLRTYSSILSEYSDIYKSGFTLEVNRTEHFFINSEGSSISCPVDLATLSVTLIEQDDNYMPVINWMQFYAREPEDLPGIQEMEDTVKSLADSLKKLTMVPVIQEQYYGPVLFMDEAAKDVLPVLINQGSYMEAKRKNLIVDSQGNIYYGGGPGNTSPVMNQRIMPDNFNLKALSHIENYEGTGLLGSFSVDAEGVVPPDEIILIRDGKLQNQLNGRTPTKEIPSSNGHRRFGAGYFSGSVAPGILELEIKEGGLSIKELKTELLKKAEEDGLQYAYIVRKMHFMNRIVPLLLYRVDVETGNEKLVRVNSSFEFLDKSLRNISAVSGNRIVFNSVLGANGGSDANTARGLFTNGGYPVSYIFPDAYIIDNVNLQSNFEPISIPGPVVPEPGSEED